MLCSHCWKSFDKPGEHVVIGEYGHKIYHQRCLKIRQETSWETWDVIEKAMIVLGQKAYSVYFKPSGYLKDLYDLWMLEFVIGGDFFEECLIESQYRITGEIIEQWFQKTPDCFYLNSELGVLAWTDFHKHFGPFEKISALDTLKRFGLSAMAQAIEKIIANIERGA